MTPAEEEQDSAQPAPKLSREEIVETLKKLVEGPVEEVKEEVDELKQAYYKQKKLEIEEAKSAFVAAGNPESDFVPAPDELEETLKSLLSVFREKKAEYTASLEKQKEENLARKQQILDEMKAITADSDNINKQYTRFQELQQAFKEPCELPSSAVSGQNAVSACSGEGRCGREPPSASPLPYNQGTVRPPFRGPAPSGRLRRRPGGGFPAV